MKLLAGRYKGNRRTWQGRHRKTALQAIEYKRDMGVESKLVTCPATAAPIASTLGAEKNR
jgi:hypothetical protein